MLDAALPQPWAGSRAGPAGKEERAEITQRLSWEIDVDNTAIEAASAERRGEVT